jgi:hypothetical protein
MAITKATIKKIIRQTCAENNFTPDRDQKWSMFCHVCDNMLHGGQITLKQHQSFTQVF